MSIVREYLLQVLGGGDSGMRRTLHREQLGPTHPYSTLYHHPPDFCTYKQSYRPAMIASGLVSVDSIWVHDDTYEWQRFETGLYRKRQIDDAFLLRTEH